MAKRNSEPLHYYEVLGVPPGAKHQEVCDAWRALAVKHHPDRGGDEEKFKRVTEAGSVLKETRARVQYDKLLRMKLAACKRCDAQGVLFYFKKGAALQCVKKCPACNGLGYFKKETK